MKSKILIIFFAFLLFEVPLGLNINLAPGLSLKNVFLYLLLVAIVIEASVKSIDFRVSLVGLHTAFLSLIFYTAISWAISSVGYEKIDYPVAKSFMDFKSSIVDRYLIMFVYLYALSDRESVLYTVRGIVGLVIFSSFLTLVELFDVINTGIIEESSEGRVAGPIGQANQYGGFLAFWIPVCVSAYLASRGRVRITLGVAVLISLGLLVLTGSRGALVGALAGSMLAVVFLRHQLPGRVVLRGSIVALIVAVAVILVVSVQFTEVIESRIERTTSDDPTKVTAGRLDIWTSGLSTMVENPGSFLYGNGWMSFRLLLNKGAHNMYLGLLFELGIIGLTLYLVLLWTVLNLLRSAVKVANQPSKTFLYGTVFGFFAVAVSTFFSELYRPWMLIWAYTGLMFRLVMLERSEAAEQVALAKTTRA